MKPETLMDILGGLDDSLLTEAVQPRRRTWVRWMAVAAAICLTVSAVVILPRYRNNLQTELPGDASAAESEPLHGDREEDAGKEEEISDGDDAVDSGAAATTKPEPMDGEAPPDTAPETTTKTAVTTTRPMNTMAGQQTTKKATTKKVTTQTPTVKNTTIAQKHTSTKKGTKGTTAKVEIPPAVMTLSKASYPKRPPYVHRNDENYTPEASVAWRDALWEPWSALTESGTDLSKFYGTTMETFLSEDNGENKVYSPLNMYIGLSMLAEITAGDSRDQLLDLLGTHSLSLLRRRNSLLWNANYRDDGGVVCRLANSMWLADGVTYKQAPLDNLAKHYYASAFAGEMGSKDYDTVLRNWLNEQTDGLLKKQVAKESLDANTALALASTISFRAKWNKAFKEEDTVKGKFKTPDGRVSTEYLCAQENHGDLYYGDRFTACTKRIDDYSLGYTMWWVLPEKDVSPEELAKDAQLQTLLSTGEGVSRYYGYDGYTLHLKVPKFDVVGKLDMTEGLKKLGVTAILDADAADFSPLMDRGDLWLDEMDHAARVAIDEEGVTAAAYTLSETKFRGGGGEENINLTFDRPFLFAVTGAGHSMLFAGIVNEP